MIPSYKISANLVKTAAPPIPLAAAWSKPYLGEFGPLINLAQGVPGSAPPPSFLEKLGLASADPEYTGYGYLGGELSLRKEFGQDVNQVYGGKVVEEDIAITAGCNLAFYAAIVSLAKAGDEVILPTPYYFNHEMTLTQLGVTPIFLKCDAPSFVPSVAACRLLISNKTRAIILVTPNNPTGAIYPSATIQEFADLALEHHLPLILDETYRELMPVDVKRSHELFTNERQDWRDVLIHLFSFSKSYAIPGHRLGAIITSPSLLSELNKTLDCIQINPPRPAQHALEWAIEGTRSWREGIRVELNQRGEIFQTLMKHEANNWKVESCAAYFAYVRHPFPSARSAVVAARLAQHVGIVLLPGSFFSPPLLVEDDRFLRFSIANVSTETLRAVPERLKRLEVMWDELEGALDTSS